MTAFDRAWALVKMPIVPGSVYRDYRREREREERIKSLEGIDPSLASEPIPKYYGAKFDDPVTGEQLDMEGIFHLNQDRHRHSLKYGRGGDIPNLDVSIKGNSHPQFPDEKKDRSYANFSSFPTFDDRFLESANTETEDEFQRKGYATALYDLAAYLGDRQRPSMKVMSSDDQTSGAKALWASRLGDLEDDEPRSWPVRGDLG